MTECTIITRNYGTMRFTLFPRRAPITVANFAETANSGFYDGLEWCRIVRDYVIQSGSPDNDIMTDSDFHITGEFASNGHDTGLDHRRGAISMARDDAPDTAGTQFFVCHRDAHKLDRNYASFGYMEEGFEVLDRIAALPTTGRENWDYPLSPPVIESVRVVSDEPLPDLQRIN